MKQVIPLTPAEFESTRVIERPDGFYWKTRGAAREFGPFATLLEAVQDMAATDDEEALEPGETAQEAGAEIGVADWIDPETGEPAEEEITHLEEH